MRWYIRRCRHAALFDRPDLLAWAVREPSVEGLLRAERDGRQLVAERRCDPDRLITVDTLKERMVPTKSHDASLARGRKPLCLEQTTA